MSNSPPSEVGGDVVGDDLRQDVGWVALLPVGAVVSLVAAAQDVECGGGVIARQPVEVVGFDAGKVSEQLGIGCGVLGRGDGVQAAGQAQVGLGELEVESPPMKEVSR